MENRRTGEGGREKEREKERRKRDTGQRKKRSGRNLECIGILLTTGQVAFRVGLQMFRGAFT